MIQIPTSSQDEPNFTEFIEFLGLMSLTTWSLVFCIFVLVFVLVTLTKNGRRSMTPVEDMANRLPGPRGFIATAKLLKKMLKKASRHMFDVTKTYGKVFGIGNGPETYVILMDYASVEETFVTKADIFSDRGGIIRAMLESVLPERGSIFNNGTAWHESRGFVAQTIKNSDFGVNTITRCIDNAVPALYSKLDGHVDRPFDPKRVYQSFCVDILHRIAFGEDITYDSDIVQRFIDDLDSVVAQTLNPSILLLARPSLISTCLFGGYRSKLQSSSQYVKTRAEEVLKHRDATEKSSSLIALFAKYIEGIRSAGKASYSEPEDGWVIVYNLFFAATDTIHEVLLWLTLFLATRPDIQEKMVTEIQSVAVELSYENRSRLPIVMSTILEVLRMRPVAPMGVPHVASEKGKVDGYSIPEGCQLFSNLWGMHNDPDVWKDPEVFNPGRFLSETGGLDEEQTKLVIPFSIGPRSCPGEQVARRTIFQTVVSLVSRYRIALPAGEPQPQLVNEKQSFTMAPERYKVVFCKI